MKRVYGADCDSVIEEQDSEKVGEIRRCLIIIAFTIALMIPYLVSNAAGFTKNSKGVIKYGSGDNAVIFDARDFDTLYNVCK